MVIFGCNTRLIYFLFYVFVYFVEINGMVVSGFKAGDLKSIWLSKELSRDRDNIGINLAVKICFWVFIHFGGFSLTVSSVGA